MAAKVWEPPSVSVHFIILISRLAGDCQRGSVKLQLVKKNRPLFRGLLKPGGGTVWRTVISITMSQKMFFNLFDSSRSNLVTLLQMLIAQGNNDRRLIQPGLGHMEKKNKARKVIALHQNVFVLVKFPFICQHLQPNTASLFYSRQVIIVNPSSLRSRLDSIAFVRVWCLSGLLACGITRVEIQI